LYFDSFFKRESLKYIFEILEHKSSFLEIDLFYTLDYPMIINNYKLVNDLIILCPPKDGVFNLPKCKIGDEVLKDILGSNKCNPNLKFIDLSHNFITDDGMKFIDNFLSYNSSLISLNLSFNLFGDTGLKYIIDTLSSNKTLKKIDFTGICITAEGAKYIKELLIHNTTLTHISMSVYFLGDEGLSYILQGLKINSTLKSLYFEDYFNVFRNKRPISKEEEIKLNPPKSRHNGGFDNRMFFDLIDGSQLDSDETIY
jgi:hypothetical protein